MARKKPRRPPEDSARRRPEPPAMLRLGLEYERAYESAEEMRERIRERLDGLLRKKKTRTRGRTRKESRLSKETREWLEHLDEEARALLDAGRGKHRRRNHPTDRARLRHSSPVREGEMDGLYREDLVPIHDELERGPFDTEANLRIIAARYDELEAFLEAAAAHEDTRQDAWRGMVLLVHLREALDCGRFTALELAMATDLGRVVERIAIRPHEPAARSGQRSGAGASKGRREHSSARAKLHEALKRRWAELATERPEMTKTGRDRHVADEFRGRDAAGRAVTPPEWFRAVAEELCGHEVSPRTVQRARGRDD